MNPTNPSPRKANYGGPERRAHPRARVEFPITIEAKDRRVAARVRDVSRSGIAFLSKIPFPEMTVLRVDVAIPGGAKPMIRADGAVVRCEKDASGDYDVAIFFTAIGDDDREEIARFVSGRLAKA
jgi:hypothetical protein